jgi:porin
VVSWFISGVLAVGLVLLVAGAAAADEDATAGPFVETWLAVRRPTTSWFGQRERLETWGVTPSLHYGANFHGTVFGGARPGKAYAGELGMDLDFDLEKILGAPGLSFHVSGSWATGTDLSDDVGNFFPVAQFAEGRQARLYTLFLQQALFDQRLDVKVGRFAVGDNFLTAPIGVYMINEAVNPMVVALQTNVPGVTAEPNATWGGRLIARPTPALNVLLGAFYSDNNLDQLTANGTEFAIDRRNGAFLIAEAAYYLNYETGASGWPGRYRIGAYYDSNLYKDVVHRRPGRRGNYGVYVAAEQMIYREGGPGSSEGLTIFAALMQAAPEYINTVTRFTTAGLSYRGLIPGRPDDTAAFALYHARFNKTLPRQTDELAFELTYGISVTPWLSVQPDLQYIVSPGGKSSVPAALVVGGQIWLQF